VEATTESATDGLAVDTDTRCTPSRAVSSSGPGPARIAATPLPPPPLPPGSIQAQRRVHANGRIMVDKQRVKLGQGHAGKLVTVVIEDTHFRILHDGEEPAIRPRKDTTPITRLYVRGKGAHPA
jgi:hypothetical protein